jgi:hypothetical protein
MKSARKTEILKWPTSNPLICSLCGVREGERVMEYAEPQRWSLHKIEKERGGTKHPEDYADERRDEKSETHVIVRRRMQIARSFDNAISAEWLRSYYGNTWTESLRLLSEWEETVTLCCDGYHSLQRRHVNILLQELWPRWHWDEHTGLMWNHVDGLQENIRVVTVIIIGTDEVSSTKTYVISFDRINFFALLSMLCMVVYDLHGIMYGKRHTVAQLVEELCYKPEGRQFESRMRWTFQFT